MGDIKEKDVPEGYAPLLVGLENSARLVGPIDAPCDHQHVESI
jgi:hypothetical protein